MSIRYGINYLYFSDEYKFRYKDTDIRFIPLFSYDEASKIAHSNDYTTTTCEIELNSDDKEIINDICHLLSFGMGCKVNWLYKSENGNKQIIKSPIVKNFSPYCSIPLLIPNQIIKFIEESIEKYREIKNKFNLQNIINIINDGKVEGDYLESRAIKICIAFEILKNAYLKESKNLLIINKRKFRKIQDELRKTLDSYCNNSDIRDDQLDLLKDNIISLNHYPFRKAIENILGESKQIIDPVEIQRIVSIRNNLIHVGEFIDQNDSFVDFLFLFSKITEIVLGLLSYKGKYLDWTKLDTENGSLEPSLYSQIEFIT